MEVSVEKPSNQMEDLDSVKPSLDSSAAANQGSNMSMMELSFGRETLSSSFAPHFMGDLSGYP